MGTKHPGAGQRFHGTEDRRVEADDTIEGARGLRLAGTPVDAPILDGDARAMDPTGGHAPPPAPWRSSNAADVPS